MITRRIIQALSLAGLLSGFGALSALAEPLIDSRANWAAHIDLQKFHSTELGEAWLGLLEKEPHRQKIDGLSAILQFDPRRQLHSVTAFGPGEKDEDGVAVLRGEFNRDHLISLVRANEDYASSVHRGVTIHSWIDDKDRRAAGETDRPPQRSYGAFQADDLLLFGKDQEGLAQALDLYSGQRQGIGFSQWLGPALQIPEGAYVRAGVRLQNLAHAHPKAALLKQAKSAQVHLGETDGQAHGHVLFEAEEPLLAEALKQIADGMVALWRLKEGKDPIETELARSVRVELQGPLVSVSWGLPVESVKRAVQAALERKGF